MNIYMAITTEEENKIKDGKLVSICRSNYAKWAHLSGIYDTYPFPPRSGIGMPSIRVTTEDLVRFWVQGTTRTYKGLITRYEFGHFPSPDGSLRLQWRICLRENPDMVYTLEPVKTRDCLLYVAKNCKGTEV